MRTHLIQAASGSMPAATLERAFNELRSELGLELEFPPEVLAEAADAAANPTLPTDDRTDLPFVTIDPPGAMDLDQALCLQRHGTGYRVFYAIADVAAFVRPGLAIDTEARRRGQTLYTINDRLPLHPPALSEAAASLLPGQVRPAMLWQADVDSSGATTVASVQRAMVRSRARYAYGQVQTGIDGGAPPPGTELLRPLGELLIAAEAARGGAGLKLPDQEIEVGEAGYELRFRPLIGVEQWNAQLSLLTGRAAAELMLASGVGILRTMPAPDDATVDRLRRQSHALGVPWPETTGYQEWLVALDVTDPRQLALAHESAALFRGAAYVSFDGEPPAMRIQAAVADEYAHVTAPLRRLVDRFGLEICVAQSAGQDAPGWVHEALAALPEIMRASDRKAAEIERASIDLAEAVLLAGRVGERFGGVIVDVRESKDPQAPSRGLVQLREPAVLARVDGTLELGAAVVVELVEADVTTRTVRFTVA